MSTVFNDEFIFSPLTIKGFIMGQYYSVDMIKAMKGDVSSDPELFALMKKDFFRDADNCIREKEKKVEEARRVLQENEKEIEALKKAKDYADKTNNLFPLVYQVADIEFMLDGNGDIKEEFRTLVEAGTTLSEH